MSFPDAWTTPWWCSALPAAQRILDEADERGVDTIVVGSRRLSDIGGLMMGSVSHKVIHLSGCTCIVVR